MNNILNKYLYDTQYFTIREYTKNKVLFNEGEICDKIYYVISGTIEIKTYTYNEKEETITVVNDNDFFGDILAFTNQRRFLGHGICTTNVKLAYITKENLLSLCKDEQFLEFYLHNICNKSIEIKKQNKLLCHKNIRDRILHFLEEKSMENKSRVIYIKSINELANILSLPRPSVSRELINMVNDKIIKKEKNIITLL